MSAIRIVKYCYFSFRVLTTFRSSSHRNRTRAFGGPGLGNELDLGLNSVEYLEKLAALMKFDVIGNYKAADHCQERRLNMKLSTLGK